MLENSTGCSNRNEVPISFQIFQPSLTQILFNSTFIFIFQMVWVSDTQGEIWLQKAKNP